MGSAVAMMHSMSMLPMRKRLSLEFSIRAILIELHLRRLHHVLGHCFRLAFSSSLKSATQIVCAASAAVSQLAMYFLSSFHFVYCFEMTFVQLYRWYCCYSCCQRWRCWNCDWYYCWDQRSVIVFSIVAIAVSDSSLGLMFCASVS